MTKHIILFLAANPSETDRLALDREARAIHAELKRSGHRDRFVFETRWAAEPLDLLRELRELKPTVVHFSGHGGYGGQRGLCLQTAEGRAQVVPPAAIAEAFGAAGASVKLVVLSACYSEPQADALLAHIDHVVGIGGSIHEDAAKIFAIGFYGGLGEHESIADAYRQGRAAIDLQGLPAGDRPQLKVRAGADAARLILAAVTPAEPEALPPCPYPGMRPYSADTATHFHGRGAEVDGMIGRLLAGERELYVIGPSGSGKSSLVAAGLLPRLARGVSGLGPFVVRSMRPGERPIARLGEVLEAPEAPSARSPRPRRPSRRCSRIAPRTRPYCS
jgi:CHAT domain